VKAMKWIGAAALMAAIAAGRIAAQTGPSIMKGVADAQTATSSAMEIAMTVVDAKGNGGERRIQTLTSEKDGLSKTITVFLSPASVKNTRFLTVENKGRDDDQWIFLPALGKVKRISAAERGGSFMGSDFSYADMDSVSMSVDEAEHALLREEKIGENECFVVESVPNKPGDYGKSLVWVDKATSVVMKVEFFAKDKATVLKRLEAEKIEKIQGHWIARKMSMTTIATGHKTLIEIVQAKFDMPVNPGYFTDYFLETGRMK